MFRLTALVIGVLLNLQSSLAGQEADSATLAEHVLATYTLEKPASEPGPARFHTINRFLASGPVDLLELKPEDCYAFALEDGLFCYGKTVEPFAQKEVPVGAVDLVASTLSTRDSPNLLYRTYINGDSIRCVTFYRDRLDYSSEGFNTTEFYGTREFAAGFVCDRAGYEARASYWREETVPWYGGWYFEIWDVFRLERTPYLLVEVTSCAGECAWLEVYPFEETLSRPILSIELWSY